MPTKPKLAGAHAADVQFKSWDQYAQEVEAEIQPFKLPISDDETLTITCPTGLGLRDMARAQATGDFEGIVAAAFGDQAERMWELAGTAGFPVINRVLADVMAHYGRPVEQLGE